MKSLAKESETQAQSSSNIISDYKLKIEEYHLSSARDFSKFYKDIEKLNILAFCERLNLKSQQKNNPIRSFILIWHAFIVAVCLGDTPSVLIGLKTNYRN